MKKNHIAALLLAATISVPALAESIATVNGKSIDKTDLDNAVAVVVQNSNGNVQDSPALRQQVKDTLINREVILQEAQNRKLDQQPAFIKRMEEVRQDMLREALFADLVKNIPITDAQLQERYNQTQSKFAGTKDIHARQITVGSEADALKIIDSLKKGAKFDELAKTRSLDPAAKQNGGDMGWGNLARMEPQLADILKDLKKGQFSSKPMQTRVGWIIFKVEDIRDAKLPPLAEVKPQIERQLQEEAIAKAVDDLRSKAKIQ
ncbi:signal peptide protein [Aquitalea magnusonii]|uniref:peptidylprolyl isomerase n=1 Tax=Aquitalea TaxID=407217 RepID=UPI0005F85C63|nr:peptidyl-prolyl cis-trans isomerase [Aquitalea sp. LB_tupeE]KJV33436.1 signal peptide protein [Aquitalea magnusonii]NWK79244.1 peptidyl-prolyl cis-trans isomerase [Aquitalea sp. LB_tupeE]